MRNAICVVAVVMAVMFCGIYFMNEDSDESSALTDGYWTFTVSNNQATLTKFGWYGTVTDLIVPSTVSDGTTTYPVVSIKGTNASNPAVKNTTLSANCTLTLPSTLTSIGTYAFYGCANFTGSLTIPDSVTSISTYAFRGCTGFTGSLTIPDSVTYLGGGAFYGCTGFTGSLTIPDSVTSIGSSAFYGCTGFTSLTIPDFVTSIGSSAFYNCSGLTTVILPDTLSSIGNNAFNLCTNLATIYNASSLSLTSGATTDGYVAYYATNVYTCHTLSIQSNDTTLGNVSDSKIYVIDGQTPVINDNVLTTSVPNQTCTATANGSSQFNEWSGISNSTPITSDTTVTAVFDQGLVTIPITRNFEQWDMGIWGHVTYSGQSSEIRSISVPVGSTYSAVGDTMTISTSSGDIVLVATPADDTAEWDYSFSTWTPQSGTILGDMTLTAVFLRDRQEYTLTVDYDANSGSISWNPTQPYNNKLPYGTTMTVNGNTVEFWSYTDPDHYNSPQYTLTATPNTNTAEYTYTFDHWFIGTGEITTDTLITPVMYRTLNEYTVTFVSEALNDSTIHDWGSIDYNTLTVPYGTSVSVYDNTVTIGSTVVTATPAQQTDYYIYTFGSWDTTGVSSIETDMTFRALFDRTDRLYTVTFQVNEPMWGSISITGGVGDEPYNSILVGYNTPITEQSTGISTQGVLLFGNSSTVRQYTVSAQAEQSTPEYIYAFDYWSTSSGYITGDTTITAYFSSTIAPHTVTFVSNDSTWGSVSPTSVTVAHGTTYSASGDTLTIGSNTVVATPSLATSEYTFSFGSWSSDTGEVNADMTITATFVATLNQYTVYFAPNDSTRGSVSQQSVTVPYGTSYSASGTTLTIGSDSITATAESPSAQYTYTFNSWSPSSGTVTGEMTIYAEFDAELRSYTVTIVSSDTAYGTVDNTTMSVYYGTSVSASGNILNVGTNSVTATPEPQTAQYIYSFASWSKSSGEITGDTTITAYFDRAVRQYDVHISVNDSTYGSVNMSLVTVDYGTQIRTTSSDRITIGTDSIIPIPHSTTSEYTYAFDSWSGLAETVTEEMYITANFTRTLREYTVTFTVNDSTYGSVSPTSVVVPYGTGIQANDNVISLGSNTITATPSASTAYYTYTFDNWGGVTSSEVLSNMDIVANFSRQAIPFTWTFSVNDGSYGSVSQQTMTVYYGDTFSVTGETISINSQTITATPNAGDDYYAYSFDEWTGVPTGDTVTGNADIVANFERTEKLYDVTITALSGGTVSQTSVSVPYRTIVNTSDNVLQIGSIEITATPNDQTAQYTYSFSGWSNVPSYITSNDTTIYAHFITIVREYTVHFVSNNTEWGTVSIPTGIVPYGTTAIADSQTHVLSIDGYSVSVTVAEPTAQYEYSFSYWSGPNTVTGESTYTAHFVRNVRQYTVTVEPNDISWGSVSPTSVTVDYGTEINPVGANLNIGSTSVTATPSESTVQYVYVFDNWSGVPSNRLVTGDITVTANFSQSDALYAVTITAGNGGTVSESRVVVPYGTNISYSGNQLNVGSTVVTANPDNATAQYTYTFGEWQNVPQSGQVTESFTVNAVFNATVNQYTVTIRPNFSDYGSVTPTSVTVDYGTQISRSGTTLTIGTYTITATPNQATAQYTYGFERWSLTYDANQTEVQQNMTATAVFNRTVNQYIVTIVSNDDGWGSVSPTSVTVDYGTNINAVNDVLNIGSTEVRATPSPTTAQYVYDFDSWSGLPASNTVVEDITVTANFTQSDVDYEILITAGNGGTVTQSRLVAPYGTPISVNGNQLNIGNASIYANPDNATAQYTYTFDEWTGVPVSGIVETNLSINAVFASTVNQYTVTISVNENAWGSVTESAVTVDYGTIIQTSGNTATIGITTVTANPTQSDVQYTYAFSNWYSATSTVESNMTLEARFTRTVNQYTISFIVNNDYGSVSQSTVTADYGTPISVDGNTISVGSTTVTAEPSPTTSQYVYDFNEWIDVPVSGFVDDDATITADFTRSDRDYEVLIVAGQNGTVSTNRVVVPYGTSVSVTDNVLTIGETQITATPNDPTAQYTYAFDEWQNVPQSGQITGNTTITAVFTSTVNQYIVTIVSNDANYGSVSLGSVTVDYGTPITRSDNTISIGNDTITATPTEDTAQYTYDFSRWDYTGNTVQEDMTVRAIFTRTLNQYTVTIVPNDDTWGDVSRGSVTVNYGTAISVENNDLTIGELTVTASPHTATPEYNFAFVEWTGIPQSGQVTEDTTVTADFERTERMYTVTISAGNGGSVNVSSVNNVPYNTNVSVVGNRLTIGITQITATPNPADAQYTYVFKEWVNVPTNGLIQTDTTIYAEFDSIINEYTVTIQSENTDYGTVSESSVVVPYGTTIDKSSNTLGIGGNSITATPNQATAQYTYSFVRWDAPDTVTGNITVSAVFKATVREYSVTISPDNAYYGSVSTGSAMVKYGTSITTDGADLYLGTTKITAIPNPADAQYTYRFTGWETPNEVTGETTIIAHFDAIYQQYIVTIETVGGGSVSSDEVIVDYGSTVQTNQNEIQIGTYTITATPNQATAQYTYAFDEWQNVPQSGQITGNTTITAVFTSTVNQYTVGFTVNNVEYGYVDINQDIVVDYGTAVTVNGDKLTIDGHTITAYPYSDKTYTSTFLNWEYPRTITETTTITAVFDRAYTKYTVTIESATPEYGSVSANTIIVDAGTRITTEDNVLHIGDRNVTATPTQNTYEYTYLFDGWEISADDITLSEIYSDVHVIAKFVRTLTEYTVFFDAGNGGSVSTPSIVAYYGAIITVDGTTLTVNNQSVTAEPDDPDAQYTYSFREWTNLPNNNTVIGATTITAEFDANVNSYVLNFHVNEPSYGRVQNSVITVPYGTSIVENGAVLTIGEETVTAIPSDNNQYYTYTFSRWEGLPSEVTGPINATAVFIRDAITYRVTLVANDGTYGEVTPSTLDVVYGSRIVIDGNHLNIGDRIATARPFAETDQWHYDFVEWQDIPESAQVTEDVTITAEFSATVREYTISLDVNQTEYGSISTGSLLVPYGTSIIADGNTLIIGEERCIATPTDATVQYLYKFAGWSGIVPTVVGNTPITAIFTRELQQYTITFTSNKSYGGWETESMTVPYGTTVSVGQSSVTIGGAVNAVHLDETDQYTTITIDSIDSPYDRIVDGEGTIALNLTRTTSVPALNIVNPEQADRERKDGSEWSLVRVIPILLIVSLIYLAISPRIRESRAYYEDNDF